MIPVAVIQQRLALFWINRYNQILWMD